MPLFSKYYIQVFNIIHRRQIFFNNINCAKLKSATFTANIRKGTWTSAVIILKSEQ